MDKIQIVEKFQNEIAAFGPEDGIDVLLLAVRMDRNHLMCSVNGVKLNLLTALIAAAADRQDLRDIVIAAGKELSIRFDK